MRATDLSGRLARATNFILDHWWLWLLLGSVLWIGLKVRSQHFMLGHLDERADAAFADVDALLVERHTLIGNLVEVVRAFATREHDVIRDVLTARVDALEAIGDAAIQTRAAGFPDILAINPEMSARVISLSDLPFRIG